MIQEITIKNYRSYKDAKTLSFEATDEPMDLEAQTVEVAPNVRLLKFCVIYGANASGKSNMLEVFKGLSEFFSGNKNGVKSLAIPFKFSELNQEQPSVFDIVYWVNGIKYKYHLDISVNFIHRESLCKYEQDTEIPILDIINLKTSLLGEAKPPKLFNKELLGMEQKEIDTINESYSGKQSIIAHISKQLDFIAFLKNSIVGYYYIPTMDLKKASKKVILSNKDFFIDYFNNYDIKVNNIKENSDNGDGIFFTHKIGENENARSFALPLDLESKGTYALLVLLSIMAVQRGKLTKTICFDELETSLHPLILERVVYDMIHSKHFGNNQVLVTTHDYSLLYQVGDLLRPDSVWFTEKLEDGSTDLYSLPDFKDIDKVTDFSRAYRNGNFGAIPNLKSCLF